MGRVNPTLRRARIDPLLCSRVATKARASCRNLGLHDVAVAAFDAGRSCYFRPLFDRPRQWAEQRAPRATGAGQNPTNR
jgi:hypothetical protein